MNLNIGSKIKNFMLNENKIKIVATVIWCLFVISQIFITFWFTGDQISDSETYLSIASSIAKTGTWYPNTTHLHSLYFFGVGYINFLSLIFRVTNNLKVIFVINILLTQLLLGSCLFILKRISYSPVVRYYFVIMFCLLNTFVSETVSLRTETIFTALCFLALAFLHTNKKYTFILCGIILAIANWIRPLGIAFLLGGIAVHIFHKRKFKTILITITSYVLTIVLIGSFSYANSGHFIYQSTTFGVNFLMSANDNGDGSYMDITQKGEAGYIEPQKAKNMIFKDYDKHFTELSLKWIMKNPLKYLAQKPAKLFYLYATETYSGSAYFNNKIATGGIDYIKSLVTKLSKRSNEKILIGDIMIIFNQIWYMLLGVLAVVGVLLKSIRKKYKILYAYLLIMVLGTGITLIVVGGARYHFPYLPIIMMYASIALETLLKKNNFKNSDEFKESNGFECL